MSSQSAPSTSTAVTCTRCRGPATVPFTPTPGRPVYCRACFAKRNAAGPVARRGGPPGGGMAAPPMRAPPTKRVLSARRKGHFVHDALAELDKAGAMDENQRRAFVEMVFTRGARQTAAAAQAFIREKLADDTLTPGEAAALGRLIDRYTTRM